MPLKLLTTDEFRGAAKDGQVDDAIVYRYAASDTQQVGDDAARTQRFIFSDATVDHSGDSIDPKGWDLGTFNKNPVALWAHNSWSPPIGRASNVAVRAGKLAGDIEFADEDTYPFADTIYRLVKGKFLRATSVGFKPKEWVFVNDNDRPYGIDFKKQTLLEISVCPVPCNPNALDEARSLGIDTRGLVEWAEKVLDDGDVLFMPRKDVEALRTQAGAPERRFYIQADAVLSDKAEARVRAAVKAWQVDPAEVLILPAGVSMRGVSEVKSAVPVAADPAPAIDDTSIETLLLKIDATEVRAAIAAALKAGRRISAATKSVLATAMEHHAAMGACIQDLMDGDGDDDEPDVDDPEPDPTDPTAEPVGADVPEDLSPEEKRLREARALRAALTPND